MAGSKKGELKRRCMGGRLGPFKLLIGSRGATCDGEEH